MLGAIYGDIIGSRFEFDRGGKTKDFKLFTEEDNWTDDTVMTIAVADALLQAGKDASAEQIRRNCIASMQAWGRKYPDAGYGARFIHWIFAHHPRAYGSFGNGSAMRVSAAGWLYDTLERTREVARITAEVSHNHPEGIKGAECTAAVIFLARTGTAKERIRKYVIEEFGYDLSKSVDEFRIHHEHNETCQDSLPKALVSFFEGTSYEDVVRNAVSLGGDTDTLGAIAGAMGEAMYGIPLNFIMEGDAYLEEDMKKVIQAFRDALGGRKEERYENNKYIAMAVHQMCAKPSREAFFTILNVLLKRMCEEGEVPVRMIDVNHVMDTLDPEKLTLGGTFTLQQDMRLQIAKVEDGNGKLWIPLYTGEEEAEKAPAAGVQINMRISDLLQSSQYSKEAAGVVINPFSESVILDQEVLEAVMKAYRDTGNRK